MGLTPEADAAIPPSPTFNPDFRLVIHVNQRVTPHMKDSVLDRPRHLTLDDMHTFQALSYGEKWRVRGFLVRGEAPRDPQMATAAVELAEMYQGRGRTYAALMRWLPAVMAVVFGAATIFVATDGDTLQAILYALIALTNIAHLMLNPATRPKNLVRSLEASKRVVTSGG
jgi:hypothetical protein